MDIYAVGDPDNLYKSSNFGVDWIQFHIMLQIFFGRKLHILPMLTEQIFLSAGLLNDAQIYKLRYKSWNCLTNIVSPASKNDIWAKYNNGKVIAVGFPNSSGVTFDQIMVSTNGGTNWTVPAINSWSTFNTISMLNENTGFIGGTAGALWKTTNGGLNWDSIPGPFGANNLRRIEFINSNTGYVFQSTAAANGLWKTTNGGINWSALTTGSVDGRGYASSFISANTGYVGNYVPKLIKTTDGGTSWTSLNNTPMGGGFIYSVNFFDENTGYACGSTGARLCKTTNGGISFDSVPQPFAAGLYAMKWFNLLNGWIFGNNGFAGATTNGGASWFIKNTANMYPYGCYMSSMDSGFVVGAYSINKLSKQLVTGTEWSGKIPESYNLKQNYPNPFNPVTIIEFEIPKSGFVSLKIFDIAGREISTPINMNLNPGVVKYSFNGANLASGIYFYRLTVDGNNIGTKKMVLIK